MISISFATPADTPLILSLIRELAEYEKLSHEVKTTEEDLSRSLFGEKPEAEVLLAFVNSEAAGFCLFFHNYSTFLSRKGLYIEDAYVRPDYRGQGVGRALFRACAQIAKERNCGRMEWWVLDWNAPALHFYEKLGAEAMRDWTVHRLTSEQFDTV